MRPSRSLSAVAGIAIVAVTALHAWAGAPTDQVKTAVDRIVTVLQDPALKSEARMKDRRAAIREAASSIFDFEETARRALGRHWQRLSEQDRAEFVPLFADLLEKSYISKIEQYSGEKISYLGESVDPAGDLATVKTAFISRNDTEVPIDYRVLREHLAAPHVSCERDPATVRKRPAHHIVPQYRWRSRAVARGDRLISVRD